MTLNLFIIIEMKIKTFRIYNKYGQNIASIRSTYVYDKTILLTLVKLGYWIETK
jgi:hypothetical protein